MGVDAERRKEVEKPLLNESDTPCEGRKVRKFQTMLAEQFSSPMPYIRAGIIVSAILGILGNIQILCFSDGFMVMGIIVLITHGLLLYGTIKDNDKMMLVTMSIINIVMIVVFVFDRSLIIFGVQYQAPALANRFDLTQVSIVKLGSGTILAVLFSIFFWIGLILQALFSIISWIACLKLYKELKKECVTTSAITNI